MTQLLLFDAGSMPSPVASGLSPGASGLSPGASGLSPGASGRSGQAASGVAARVPAAPSGNLSAASSSSGSIPLYDPQQGELHRMGDLARLVLARYELVAQRRAAMRARR